MVTRSEIIRPVRIIPYAFVGDLHGRYDLLRTILERDKNLNYHYIFLGDTINQKPYFKHSKRCSPVKVLRVLKELVDKGKATLILGNNENYVLNSLVLPSEKIKKKELRYTLECLKELPLDERLGYISMLSNSSLSLELDGKYRLAHAYYPHEGRNIKRETILFGPGYAWFRDTDLQEKHGIDPSYTYFFGHYGLPYRHKNINILDGTSLEATGVYYTDRDEVMVYY